MNGLGNSWSRREFVQGLAVGATAGVLGMPPEEAVAEPPPETKTLRVLEIPALWWHEYNPEDTVRSYALRLHEVGMLKSSPQKIIAQGTNWRFFNELRKELKA
jgi:hypothetical protein